jgi:hypothetical protein
MSHEKQSLLLDFRKTKSILSYNTNNERDSYKG